MGFFNAGMRLGAVQGFQRAQQDAAKAAEERYEIDKKRADKAAEAAGKVISKRKALSARTDFLVDSAFADTQIQEKFKDISLSAFRNYISSAARSSILGDGKVLNPRDLNAHLRSGRVTPENIAEYEPVSKVSETSEKEKTEEGIGVLASILSPRARGKRLSREYEEAAKPSGISEEEWKAAIRSGGKTIGPVVEKPEKPVMLPRQLDASERFSMNKSLDQWVSERTESYNTDQRFKGKAAEYRNRLRKLRAGYPETVLKNPYHNYSPDNSNYNNDFFRILDAMERNNIDVLTQDHRDILSKSPDAINELINELDNPKKPTKTSQPAASTSNQGTSASLTGSVSNRKDPYAKKKN